MPDDQNQLPLGPDDNITPSAQDANSNNPPPSLGGSGGGDGPSAPTGPGALLMLPINIDDEMRRSYLDYSMSVIIGRALPDARDGLKPVHRRVLYGMQEMGLQFNKKYTKSAKVVGHVMGNYHPHGDAAIYDTMVRLAQPFSLRYPLVDGQGNFGSVDGDPPAAMRYTESRLTRLSGEMLADIDSDTVDFVPNYDESTSEPSVLPARIPNLIVNGSTGIAVGMATNIPPHNLTEVLNATIALLTKSPQDTTHDLALVLEHVKGPDFPTGGFLYGRGNLAQTYNTGRGRFMMRAKCGLEQITGGRQAIIVTEIPYQVNKSNLIKRIAEIVNEKIVDDISDVRDESDRDGMRIVIELKRGAQHEIVLNQLYKNTQMQESFSMIFLAVLNGQPKELPLHHAIHAFIDHRIDVVRRRTAFLLGKARDREHTLLGLQIAVDNLDAVIRIVRQSNSRADARENLFAFFSNRTHLAPRHRTRRHHARPRQVRHRSHRRQHLRAAHGQQLRCCCRHADPQLPPDRRHPRTAALPPHPALHRRAPQRTPRRPRKHRRVRIHPRLREKTPRRHPSSSSKRFATNTVTSAAPSSSTRPTSSPSKTSSPTSRSPSPSATPATSSARPSPSTASKSVAAPGAWA